MANSSTIPTVGSTQATPTLYNNVVQDALRLLQVSGGKKTISGGDITVAPGTGQGHYVVDTEGAAAVDYLSRVLGLNYEGDIISLVSANAARTVIIVNNTIKNGVETPVQITLHPLDAVLLRYDGNNWIPFIKPVNYETFTNGSGSTRNAGDVVILKTAAAGEYTTTTTAGDVKVLGVVASETTNTSVGGLHTDPGKVLSVNVDTAAVNIGDFLKTSTTAGRATSSATKVAGSFAVALSSKSAGSTGTVSAMLIGGYGS